MQVFTKRGLHDVADLEALADLAEMPDMTARLTNALLTSPANAPAADAPPAAQFLPRAAHLADVLEVIPVGPGSASAPRLVGDGLDAGTQSSEGRAAPSNVLADIEVARVPFALAHTSISGSRQALEDATLRAMVDGELLETLRAAVDSEIAGQLGAVAPVHTVTGSTDPVPALIEAVFAFGRRWGAPRAIAIDHAWLEANAAVFVAAAGGAVSFDGGALRIAGIPCIGVHMPIAYAEQALITRAAILVREAEAISTSDMHSNNFAEGRQTVKATTRVAGVGPALRVAI